MVYKCAVNSDVNNCFEDDKRNIAINLKKTKSSTVTTSVH